MNFSPIAKTTRATDKNKKALGSGVPIRGVPPVGVSVVVGPPGPEGEPGPPGPEGELDPDEPVSVEVPNVPVPAPGVDPKPDGDPEVLP